MSLKSAVATLEQVKADIGRAMQRRAAWSQAQPALRTELKRVAESIHKSVPEVGLGVVPPEQGLGLSFKKTSLPPHDAYGARLLFAQALNGMVGVTYVAGVFVQQGESAESLGVLLGQEDPRDIADSEILAKYVDEFITRAAAEHWSVVKPPQPR